MIVFIFSNGKGSDSRPSVSILQLHFLSNLAQKLYYNI